MRKVLSIAIDGPAGAGKSTVAREVARRLDAMYLDTGAMYRAIGLYMLRNGISLNDANEIIANCDAANVNVRFVNGAQRIYLSDADVSEEIRSAEASYAASQVSAVPEVRRKMVAKQREIAKGHDVVMDGRDIGTDVLPDATLKIYLTASSEVRAKRRHAELIKSGVNAEFSKVLEELMLRDEHDMGRSASPLRKTADAIEIDTSELEFDEVVEDIIALSREAMNKYEA